MLFTEQVFYPINILSSFKVRHLCLNNTQDMILLKLSLVGCVIVVGSMLSNWLIKAFMLLF